MKIVTSQNQSYDPIAEGVWEADITRIFEHKEFNRFDNKEKEGIKFEFTITEGEQRERKAYRFVSPFLTPRSTLWAIWKAIKGEDPTAEDLAAVQDISDIIGFMGAKPIKIIVKNKKSTKGNVYYTVTDFMKSSRLQGEFPFEQGVPEGMAPVDTTNPGQPTQPEVAQTTLAPEPPRATKDEIKSIADELDDDAPVAKAAGKKVV